MTRPHEETWRAIDADSWEHVVALVHDDGKHTGMFFGEKDPDKPEVSNNIEARASLAAQAPAMARLLLKLQWNGGAQGDSGMCPSCFEFPTAHASDCELAAVLRAAGVLP